MDTIQLTCEQLDKRYFLVKDSRQAVPRCGLESRGRQWSWGPQGAGAQSFGRAKRCACRCSGRDSTSMAAYVEMFEAFQS